MYETVQDVKRKFLFQMMIPFSDFLQSENIEEMIQTYDHDIISVDEKGRFFRPQGLPYLPDEKLLLFKIPGYYEIWETETFVDYIQNPFDFSGLELTMTK
jgi:hypothetical protein